MIKLNLNVNIAISASIPLAAMTICSVLGGIIAEKIGRKKTILFIAPLLAIGLITQGLANESHVLNVGRFISGVAGGLAFGPAAVNVSQISEMKSYFQKNIKTIIFIILLYSFMSLVTCYPL